MAGAPTSTCSCRSPQTARRLCCKLADLPSCSKSVCLPVSFSLMVCPPDSVCACMCRCVHVCACVCMCVRMCVHACACVCSLAPTFCPSSPLTLSPSPTTPPMRMCRLPTGVQALDTCLGDQGVVVAALLGVLSLSVRPAHRKVWSQ